MLEELAAFFTIGRTTSQLFFTDGDRSDPPLLLRMASDCSDGLFMYASQTSLRQRFLLIHRLSGKLSLSMMQRLCGDSKTFPFPVRQEFF